ncbi:MAG: sulfotransferase family protein [Gemmatimonadota bacterium]
MRALGWANALGRGLARIGLRTSLEEESLLRSARRVTRLSDFGDEEFRTPLRRLLQAYEEEVFLSPTDRLIKRIDLVDMLATRLRVQRLIVRHPEILEEPVRRPLIVTGLPRTGTTLLQRLLSLDPNARPLLGWEALWPAPISRRRAGRKDSRIGHARRVAWTVRRFLPGIDRIHPIDPEGPEECTRLLGNAFRWGYMGIELLMPGYAAWLESQGPRVMEPAYREYALQLQVLQHQRPVTGHWVLKSPAHLWCLRPLLNVIPDARIVITVRDPRATVASACSLYTLFYGVSAARARTSGLGLAIATSHAEALTRGLETAARDPQRIQVMRYEDLIDRSVETLREVHAGFGIPFPAALETAVRGWLEVNPQGRHGIHRYDLETYGLDDETVLRLFEASDQVMRRIERPSRK